MFGWVGSLSTSIGDPSVRSNSRPFRSSCFQLRPIIRITNKSSWTMARKHNDGAEETIKLVGGLAMLPALAGGVPPIQMATQDLAGREEG